MVWNTQTHEIYHNVDIVWKQENRTNDVENY